ncbi:MAG: hypothetical protein U1E65_28205 [Myxococcota bacterium]
MLRLGVLLCLAIALTACPQSIVTTDRPGPNGHDGSLAMDALDPGDADAGEEAGSDADPRDVPGADATSKDVGFLDAMSFDLGVLPDTGPPPDAGFPDALPVDGGAIDPDLALPDPAGQPCTTPGSLGECPNLQVCRIYTGSEGRCESCGPCGNLGAFCTTSAECDILFACFRNACVNFCEIGTFECGPMENCVDVGFPGHGMCKPM